MIAPRFLPVVMAPQPPTEWNRTAIGALGQQRRRVVGLHLVGMVDAEHEERRAVRTRACRPCARGCRSRTRTRRSCARAGSRASPGRRRRANSRGIWSARDRRQPARRRCSALCSAVRMSRPIGLSPAIGSSVRSRMMTFFLPASALTTAASGNGRNDVEVNRIRPSRRGARAGSPPPLRCSPPPIPATRTPCRRRRSCTG